MASSEELFGVDVVKQTNRRQGSAKTSSVEAKGRSKSTEACALRSQLDDEAQIRAFASSKEFPRLHLDEETIKEMRRAWAMLAIKMGGVDKAEEAVMNKLKATDPGIAELLYGAQASDIQTDPRAGLKLTSGDASRAGANSADCVQQFRRPTKAATVPAKGQSQPSPSAATTAGSATPAAKSRPRLRSKSVGRKEPQDRAARAPRKPPSAPWKEPGRSVCEQLNACEPTAGPRVPTTPPKEEMPLLSGSSCSSCSTSPACQPMAIPTVVVTPPTDPCSVAAPAATATPSTRQKVLLPNGLYYVPRGIIVSL